MVPVVVVVEVALMVVEYLVAHATVAPWLLVVIVPQCL